MLYSRATLLLGLVSAATSLAVGRPYSEAHHRRDSSSSCTNGPSSRGCWCDGYDINTCTSTTGPPNTGKVVSYTLTLTNETLSPDGVPKQMLVVNGQYPGPTIEANWGDTLSITVDNQLTNNGTSMHWHGMRQVGTNDMDGVNGVTECPLAPGASKTYTFQASDYGTTWYHSHFAVQYTDGVMGPIVIHGPASANYDEDLGPIMVSDWYEGKSAWETSFEEQTQPRPPNATNYLLNGQNQTPDGSSGQRPEWTFVSGKKYLMRFINPSTDNHFKIALDGHTMQVIATDFVPIVPYYTTSINIGVGQRYDVVVEADQPCDSYYLRGINQVSCAFNDNTGLGTANGIIRYSGASDADPTSTYAPYTDACEDEPAASTVPYISQSVDSSAFAAQVSTLPVALENVSTTDATLYRWFLNSESMIVNWSDPTLMQVAQGSPAYNIPSGADYPRDQGLITLPDANVWTYWVIQNTFLVPHPLHLHGHTFSLLGAGNGTFDTSMVDQLNFADPTRRDVTVLPANGWSVIAFQTDNPGAWLMHCHIAWHVNDGLSLQFLEVPSAIPDIYGEQAAGFQQECDQWDSYYNALPAPDVNTQSSGLR